MPRFVFAPDRSKVTIAGKTNLHAVTAGATGLEGFLDGRLTDGRLDLDRPPEARIELAVGRITSDNALFVRELQRRVEARKFPLIVGELRRTERSDCDGTYRMTGDVTFHGVTRQVSGEVAVSIQGGSMLLAGEQTFDVRDFGLAAPRLLVLRAEPEVRVRIDVRAELEEPSAGGTTTGR